MKEFQSLALDVRVLKEDMTEVEIQEGGDVINRSLTSIIESSPGDNRIGQEENFESYGFKESTLEEETGEENTLDNAMMMNMDDEDL